MFTGIIEEVGEIIRVEQRGDAARLTVRGPRVVPGAHHGDSIAVSGVCLTVIALHNSQGDTVENPDSAVAFTADVMRETLNATTLGSAASGRPVNLERAARVGDRLGGHIVQGHVDATASLISRVEGEAWRVLRFSLPTILAPLVVRKGSIAVDGTSLTVSAVSAPGLQKPQKSGSHDPDRSEPGRHGPGQRGSATGAGTEADATADTAWFEVSLIPETLSATTLGALEPGDRVNIESDMLARHIERLIQFDISAINSTKEAQ